MAKENPNPQQPTAAPVSLADFRCVAEGCNKKKDRADFCTEHFMWFKEGLLTKEGKHPKDFDKKYMQFKFKNAS